MTSDEAVRAIKQWAMLGSLLTRATYHVPMRLQSEIRNQLVVPFPGPASLHSQTHRFHVATRFALLFRSLQFLPPALEREVRETFTASFPTIFVTTG